MYKSSAALIVFLCVIIPGVVLGNNVPVEDALEGFDTEELDLQINTEADEADLTDRNTEFYGKVIFSSALFTSDPDNTECRNYGGKLGELKAELELNLKLKFAWEWDFVGQANLSHDFAFRINGRENYTDAYLSDSETEADVQDFYIEKSLAPWMDMSIGRQIVAWGTSESLRVVDVINPIDRRRFGMTDIEDLRLAAAMTRMDFYSRELILTTLLVHEVRYDKRPECGSPFYVGSGPSNYNEKSSSLENTQYGGKLSRQFDGWDASLHVARVFDDAAYLNENGTYQYPKVWMLGGVWTAAFGNLLVKTEVAWFDGVRFSAVPDEDKSKLKTLFGVEYAGLKDTTITGEIKNTHIISYQSELSLAPDYAKQDYVESAFRVKRQFLNETLHFVFLAGFSEKNFNDGSFQRLEVEYDVTDNISVRGGAVLYHGGESRFYEAIKQNDMVFLQFKWFFS